MANGKIMGRNHIVEEMSLRCVQSIFPIEWISRKLNPDYGIDIELELLGYEDGVCVTLGEHVFLQVKGTENPDYVTIKPVGAQLYTQSELADMALPVIKFVIDVPLLKLVERMGSAIPVLLTIVDIKEQKVYYICLNDYVRYVLPFRETDYRNQDTITLYIPQENILTSDIASWYGKRAKLYGLIQELLTLADDVQHLNANHKVDLVRRRFNIIAHSDAWSICNYWSALDNIKEQLDEMMADNMLSFAGKSMLDRLVDVGEDPSAQMVQYGSEPECINALLAAQAISCDTFLDQAKAVCAMFENNVRHMGLPTQLNWMLSR